MAWIESHTVLLRHRKVLQLAADLSLQPVYIVGHLHALWHAVLEQQEDGDLGEWPDEMIAQAAHYQTGDAGTFVLALQRRNWLDGKLVHDWIEYAGLFLTKKYSTANPLKLREIWKRHGYKYGKRDSKSLYRIANRKRTESEPKANLPNLTRPNLTRPNLTRPNLTKETRTPLNKISTSKIAMPGDWNLTDSMKAYAVKQGMTELTIEHQFLHCKTHHMDSKFTPTGWASKTWQTWVLNWVSFGQKQVKDTMASFEQRMEKWAKEGAEHDQA